MIRKGEESQEDSLKIRSVENFMGAWMWILRSFLLDFRFSFESELRKFLNSQTWQTCWKQKSCVGGEILTRNWKNEHGFICWDFYLGSWDNKFQSILRCLSWYLDENMVLQSKVNDWVSWSSMKEIFFEVWWKVIWVKKTSEKFVFS